jgi:hypothetical protein
MFAHLIAVCIGALAPAATGADAFSCVELAIAATAATDDEGEAALIVVIGARESRGRAGVIGDGGLARGRFQMHPPWWQGHAAEELDADPFLDAVLARDTLRTLERTCGTRLGAVAAYASGGCNRALDLARQRCALAGGCAR